MVRNLYIVFIVMFAWGLLYLILHCSFALEFIIDLLFISNLTLCKVLLVPV